jgi:hypothetical protein
VKNLLLRLIALGDVDRPPSKEDDSLNVSCSERAEYPSGVHYSFLVPTQGVGAMFKIADILAGQQ